MLTKTSTLWVLFVFTILNTLAFILVSNGWDLTLLDGISSPADARGVLSEYSSLQKTVHLWTTSTLDVMYPLMYGGLFAGVALRFFDKFGLLLALPALLSVPVDLFEGLIQVLALTDTVDWLDMKAFVTPLKTDLFLAGLTIAVAGWVKWLFLKLKR